MTLCIAWQRQGGISLASDSRLTGGEGHILTDIATKIYSIGVKITSRDRMRTYFLQNYGLCFTGSYLNGSLLADTISELLSHLVLDDTYPIDAETIAGIAFQIYQDVSRHLMAINRQSGLSEMWLAGYCSASQRNRLFRFSWQYGPGNDAVDFTFSEERFVGIPLFLGDHAASGRATELSRSIQFANGVFANGYTEYHVLREIIRDRTFPTVGGAIQTGHILHHNFSLFGMVDYELFDIPNSSAKWVKDVFTFRGIPLIRGLETVNAVKVDTSILSMAPFIEKKTALEAEATKLNEQIR